MLREKSEVNADEYENEVRFYSVAVFYDACYEGESVSKSCENGEDGAYGENVMEMSYDVVCVMKYDVKGGIREDNAS